VSWLKISQVFNNDLLLGCVYIPLENSLCSSMDAFLDNENELVNFIEKDMKCVLVGDFNAKTAVLEDFSEPDETFLNVMDVNVEDDLFRYHIAMTTKFYLIIIFPLKDILSVNADQIILDENF
jgi:hypothetical protein